MPSSPQWLFASFRLDLDNACLWRDAQAIALTPKAFAVLHYLVAHPDRLVTKEALLDAVWPETAVSEAVLPVVIGELRKVLGDPARAPQYIATVHRRGYRFLAPVTVAAPPDAEPPVASPPRPLASTLPLLVGREAVLHRLHEALTQARQGRRQVVFVTGEAGMGKTAVVEALAAHVATEPAVWLAHGQCVELYGTGEAYLPILEALGQLCRTAEGPRLVALLRQQAPTWLLQMPWLLSAADQERLRQELHGATRERMLREFAEVVDALTAATPLLLILEDLHWSDYATLDLLALLARRRTPARLFVLGTYRPVEVLVPGHPLRTVTHELRRHGHGTELPLAGLSAAAVGAYLAARCPGHRFPETLVRWLHQHTDGNPLFLVTLVAALVARGVLAEQDGRWTLVEELEAVAVEVPEGLRPLLEQQLEHLPVEWQQAVEVASAVGVTFSAAAVAAGLEVAVAQLEERCDALVRRQVLRPAGLETWPDGTMATRYEFVHALYQQAAYERLGVGQRAHVHQHLGVRLELAYGSQVEEIATELAVHFERGRDTRRAVQYLEQAGANASRRSAHQEAIALLTRGLELLQTLPETPERTQHALTLYIALGAALQMAKGHAAPEVEHAYTQAYALCQQVGETPQLAPVLFGLWRYYMAQSQFHTARELGETLLHLAQQAHDPALAGVAHYALGATWFYLGALPESRQHLEEGIALYTPDQRRAPVFRMGVDPGVASRAFAAMTLWMLGYPEQALARLHDALALAHELSHPFSLAFARCWAAFVSQFRRDVPVVHEHAEAAVALSTEQGFPLWAAYGTSIRGWALAMQGQGEAGMAEVRQGIAACRATGAAMNVPYVCTLLAEVCDHLGHPEAGLQALAEAHTLVEQHEERRWEAEICRLRGVLLLRQARTPQGEAETWLRRALDVARRQEAKSLELRAAMSLARLWQQQGRRAEACELLAEIYGWFTEGFATADLQEARTLLDELA